MQALRRTWGHLVRSQGLCRPIDEAALGTSGGTMITSSFSSLTTAWVAVATGVAGLLALAFIALFFAVGQPFGTLNDGCNGLAAILSGVLAWMLSPQYHSQSPLLSQVALVVAVVGALVVAAGSVLVIFGITGWFLAGLCMGAGNALIGLWLLGLSYSALSSTPWSHGLVARPGRRRDRHWRRHGAWIDGCSRDVQRHRCVGLRPTACQVRRAGRRLGMAGAVSRLVHLAGPRSLDRLTRRRKSSHRYPGERMAFLGQRRAVWPDEA